MKVALNHTDHILLDTAGVVEEEQRALVWIISVVG